MLFAGSSIAWSDMGICITFFRLNPISNASFMKMRDIAKLPVFAHMDEETKKLRTNAPRNLRHIIEKTRALKTAVTLRELGKRSLRALQGGMLSVVYQFTQAGETWVIKFRIRGIRAEAETLLAWRTQGARVVEVKKVGEIPGSDKKIRYFIAKAVTGKGGRPVPTCAEYVILHPEQSYTIGLLLGEELAKMHRATSGRRYGEFGDMSEKPAPYNSWNEYLIGYLEKFAQFFERAGISSEERSGLKILIESTKFPENGVYVHGDFGLRNSLLESEKPLAIRIFDPNPLIGDPSWDLAVSYNNRDFSERRMRAQPENREYQSLYERDREVLRGMLKAYKAASGKNIPERKILMSQMAQCLILLEIEQRKEEKAGRQPEAALEFMTRLEVLRFLARRLLKKPASR